MIWNVHKSYLISEKAQTWGFFLICYMLQSSIQQLKMYAGT